MQPEQQPGGARPFGTVEGRADWADWRELIRRAQRGDRGAQTTLLEANQRLVQSVIQRLLASGCSYEREELFQVGCIGLLKAIQRFDLGRPVEFSTYAVPMILGEIRTFLRENQPVRASRGLRELALRVEQARIGLRERQGQEPTVGELAEFLAVPRAEVVAALEVMQKPRSLYEEVGEADGDAPRFLLEQIADETQGDWREWVDNLALREALAKLPARQRQVLLLRFVKEMTQAQVAEVIGVSQVQVCRLEKKALTFLRERMAGG